MQISNNKKNTHLKLFYSKFKFFFFQKKINKNTGNFLLKNTNFFLLYVYMYIILSIFVTSLFFKMKKEKPKK